MDAYDPDDDDLTYAISTHPTLGSIEYLDATTGALSYHASDSAAGLDQFSIRVTDPEGLTTEAQINVHITGPEDSIKPWIISRTPMQVSADESIEWTIQVDTSQLENPDLSFSALQALLALP